MNRSIPSRLCFVGTILGKVEDSPMEEIRKGRRVPR
jgi:hypothetical protein